MTTLKTLSQLLGKRAGGRTTQGAVGTFGMRVASTGLTFLTAVLLSRLLGTLGYGTYAVAFAWVNLLAIPTALGMDKLLVREVSVYGAQRAWGKASGILRWSNAAVLGAGLLVAGLAGLVAWFVVDARAATLTSFLIALVSLPFTTLTSLRQAAMRGFDHIIQGQLPELLLRPVLIIGFVALGWLLLGPGFSAPWAAAASVLATAIAFSVGAYLLNRVLTREVREAVPEYEVSRWLRSALPFLIIGGMYVINARTDVVMLGALRGEEAAGIFTNASRGAELISFILLAVNTALAPTFARQYAQGEFGQLERTVAQSTRLITLFSLPLALGFIFFGYWFLLLFGQGFTAGTTALAILSVGQLVNAATGSVGMALNMSGHERDTAVAVGVSAALNVVLNALLIPRFGLEGAATATALSTLTWNVLLSIFVYRRLGFYSVLGLFTLKRTKP